MKAKGVEGQPVAPLVKQDADYLKASILENELNQQCKKLDFSHEQRLVITRWTETIQAQESAYIAVVFQFFLTNATG